MLEKWRVSYEFGVEYMFGYGLRVHRHEMLKGRTVNQVKGSKAQHTIGKGVGKRGLVLTSNGQQRHTVNARTTAQGTDSRRLHTKLNR